jgi:hypothetical protein
MVILAGRLILAQFRVLCETCCKWKVNFYSCGKKLNFYPESDSSGCGFSSGGGNCSLEEGSEGQGGGEESAELHVEINSSA